MTFFLVAALEVLLALAIFLGDLWAGAFMAEKAWDFFTSIMITPFELRRLIDISGKTKPYHSTYD